MYVTIAQLRAAGITEAQATDDALTALEAVAHEYIDRVTGLFFEPQLGATLLLDGTGTPTIELPAPALELTSVKVDGFTIAPTEYVNYNRRPELGFQDFWYPRLKMKGGGDSRLERAFPGRSSPGWARGEQNVEVVGSFGFCVSLTSGAASAATVPPQIARAALLLVKGIVEDDASAGAQGSIISETIGNYSYKLADGSMGSNLVQSPEVDFLLAGFRRVMAAMAV